MKRSPRHPGGTSTDGAERNAGNGQPPTAACGCRSATACFRSRASSQLFPARLGAQPTPQRWQAARAPGLQHETVQDDPDHAHQQQEPRHRPADRGVGAPHAKAPSAPQSERQAGQAQVRSGVTGIRMIPKRRRSLRPSTFVSGSFRGRLAPIVRLGPGPSLRRRRVRMGRRAGLGLRYIIRHSIKNDHKFANYNSN